jgi:acetyl-CoA C-acetyltransferase
VLLNITFLEDQDKYAIQSYERSAKAWEAVNLITVVPVPVPQRKGDPIIVSKDEEFTNVKIEKIPTKRCFSKEGTVTAANASTINDGAAMILMRRKALSLGLKPLAFIKVTPMLHRSQNGSQQAHQKLFLKR